MEPRRSEADAKRMRIHDPVRAIKSEFSNKTGVNFKCGMVFLEAGAVMDIMERIPTHVEGLDENMQGGIPKGHICIVAVHRVQ